VPTKCGTVGADVRPNWLEQPEWESLTGKAVAGQVTQPPKKRAPEPATPRRQHRWAIYHLKGTPAKLLGHVEAPDEESAIKRAIEEFNVPRELQKRLLAQRRS
jgi:hypothetical protein